MGLQYGSIQHALLEDIFAPIFLYRICTILWRTNMITALITFVRQQKWQIMHNPLAHKHDNCTYHICAPTKMADMLGFLVQNKYNCTYHVFAPNKYSAAVIMFAQYLQKHLFKEKITKLIISTYVSSNTEPIYAKKCISENMSVISLLRQGDDLSRPDEGRNLRAYEMRYT